MALLLLLLQVLDHVLLLRFEHVVKRRKVFAVRVGLDLVEPRVADLAVAVAEDEGLFVPLPILDQVAVLTVLCLHGQPREHRLVEPGHHRAHRLIY